MSGDGALHVGIFVEERRWGVSESQALREACALAEAADAWGLDGVWLGEIHFNGERSVQSAPLALASFIAARTRRVRVGTAVQVLPLGNPLRIAEEVATVDHLSEGRFDFGVGRSGAARTYDLLGIPYGESQARFAEALAIIREAWKGEPFSYHGTFYRVDEVTVSPRPRQRPHPPIRMAANSPETYPVVAQLGLPLFIGLRDLDVPGQRAQLPVYRQAWTAAGHAGPPDVYLRVPVYAAPTAAAAAEEPRDNIVKFFERHAELARSAMRRSDAGPVERHRERVDRVTRLTYDDILRDRVAFGTAPALVEKLGRLREELGLAGVVAELNPGGGFSTEQMERTLRILTHEVMPAFR